MDYELIKRLLHQILNADVYIVSNQEDLGNFQSKNCFNEKLQPLFTAQSLAYLIESMSDNTFYEIFDKLNLCVFFFKFEESTFIIGPYAASEPNEKNLQKILIHNNIPASFLKSLLLYYTNYSIHNTYELQHVVTSIIVSFCPEHCEYQYRSLLGFEEKPEIPEFYYNEEIDYSDIYKRYNIENYLLDSITKGEVSNIKAAFHSMISQPQSVTGQFSNTAYQSPSAILRALARKAAEKGGLSVITIDEITQRYAQRMSPNANVSTEKLYLSDMLTELAMAVNENKKKAAGLSPAVLQVIEHIELNYSQNITTESLCRLTGYSSSRLSTLFKAETGKTVTEYIAFIRCEKAKELLTETQLSIQNISSYVGYSDNNYFVKVFKKQYQTTPSAYRNQREP